MLAFDANLIRVARADLEHIGDQTNSDATNHRLRRVSTQLHFLLIEGVLMKAWKMLELAGPFHLSMMKMNRLVLERSEWACASDVNYGNGLTVGGACYIPGEFTDDDIRALATFKPQEFTLSEMLESYAIKHGDVAIKRRQLIQYVAVKLGGKHYDKTRKSDDVAYLALDKFSEQGILFSGQDDGVLAVFSEIMAIGQALHASPDTARFIDAAEARGL
jgi:hypothetical protein